MQALETEQIAKPTQHALVIAALLWQDGRRRPESPLRVVGQLAWCATINNKVEDWD